MSTEKDGTPVPPPEVDDDVTHVKNLADLRAGEDDVTRVKPMEQIAAEAAAAQQPPMPANGEANHSHEVSGEAAPAAEAAADGGEEVEEVSDVEVLEEELAEPPLEEPPALDQAIAAAQNLLAEGGHARLVALYERELEVLARGEPEKGRIALYQHEIGELTESRAGDEGAAVKAYARALQSDATLKPNLWAIRRVFERRALWPNLQKLLDAEIRFAKTADERAELLVEKGELLEDRLNDPAGALECYHKAVEAQPRALAAGMALEK